MKYACGFEDLTYDEGYILCYIIEVDEKDANDNIGFKWFSSAQTKTIVDIFDNFDDHYMVEIGIQKLYDTLDEARHELVEMIL